jgi:hypothetical protein
MTNPVDVEGELAEHTGGPEMIHSKSVSRSLAEGLQQQKQS